MACKFVGIIKNCMNVHLLWTMLYYKPDNNMNFYNFSAMACVNKCNGTFLTNYSII